jgi:drug/metabolite transporter (DMT)-like permease
MPLARVEKGIFFITLSCFSSALFGLFIKISASEVAIPFLIVMRFLVPLAICVPIFYVADTFKKLGKTKHFLAHSIRALFIVLSQYCYFYYLTKSSLLNATMLFNTAPIYIPIVSKYIFKDASVKLLSKSIIISLLGVLLLIRPDESLLASASWVGVLSGVFLAISQSIYGENVQDDTLDENLFYMFSISGVLTTLVLLIFFAEKVPLGIQTLIAQTPIEWLFIFLIGICTILNQFFRGVAYLAVKPYLLAPLMNLTVFFAFFFDILIFKKAPDYLSIVGSLLIITGSLLKWHSLKKAE